MEELSNNKKIKKRTLSRIKAIQVLYGLDLTQNLFCSTDTDELLELEKDAFARHLIEQTLDRLPITDEFISKNLKDWKFHRINYIDRNILRLGVCELLLQETDKAVIINEYIEIAKIFGTEHSTNFVNAILDKF